MDDGASSGKAKFSHADERIFALLAIVEDQQTAVRAGLQGLTQERAALATERVALVQQAQKMERLSDKLSGLLVGAIPKMAQTAGEASRAAFLAMLRQTGEQAAGIAAKAAKPELDKFKAAVDSAAAMQLQLRAAVKDFQRQWAWVVAFAIGATVVAAALVSYGAVWWQLRELGQLQAQRNQLRSEVNALKVQADQAEQGKRNNGHKPAK